MNVNALMAEIQKLKEDEERIKMLKEALTKKRRETLSEVDKKLLEIRDAAEKLGIKHLDFVLPYRDKYGYDFFSDENGILYVSGVGGGRYFFHNPTNKDICEEHLSRMGNILDDPKCAGKIERAFFDRVKLYISINRTRLNDEFKELFNALANLTTETEDNKKWILVYAIHDASGCLDVGHVIFDKYADANEYVENMLADYYDSAKTETHIDNGTTVIKTAPDYNGNCDEWRISALCI